MTTTTVTTTMALEKYSKAKDVQSTKWSLYFRTKTTTTTTILLLENYIY